VRVVASFLTPVHKAIISDSIIAISAEDVSPIPDINIDFHNKKDDLKLLTNIET
jgi:hypothetical protein